MKGLGQLQYFLGIQTHFHPTGLFLSQEKYATGLLITAGMADCAPMPTPLPLQVDKVSGHDELFPDATYFRSLADKLQYLTPTRPDLQYAVNFVYRKMHSPTMADFSLLKRILRYLKGTLQMGINLDSNTDLTLRAYNDSDWAVAKKPVALLVDSAPFWAQTSSRGRLRGMTLFQGLLLKPNTELSPSQLLN